jgi:serine/threonine-protein kinase
MDFTLAEQSFRHSLQAAQKLNGDEHVDTLETEMRLGLFLNATSRPSEGLQHLERARQILLQTRGADDPFYAPQVFLEYGWALARIGRLEEGLAYISKAAENRRKNRPGTRFMAQILERQASVLIEMGRYAEARRLSDEAAAIAKKVNFPTDYQAADNRSRLLVIADHTNEADGVLAEFHPPAGAAGSWSLEALQQQSSQAEIALARGDAQVAARLAGDVRLNLSASKNEAFLRGPEARAALVEGRARLMLGGSAEALPLLRRAVELRQSLMDSTSPELADAQIALAECYLDLGDGERAKALVADAAKALRSHREVGEEYTRQMLRLQQRLREISASAKRAV